VLVSSTIQVSVGDQIRVTAGFREGKSVFKNNDIAQVRAVTDTELVLHEQAVPRSKVQSRDRMMPDLWATRQVQIVQAMEMER
jgi:hypothetical protein